MNDSDLLRDLAVMTLIFGVAAFVWFYWDREDPPRRWRIGLIVGSVSSLRMIIIGGLLSWHLRGAGSVFEDLITRRNFGIVCGIEFGAGRLRALLLNLTKHPRLVAPWILLVVGAHLVPLAVILRDPGLHVLGLLMVAGAVLAVNLHPRRQSRRARSPP